MKYNSILKSFLHTRLGAFMGFHLGIRGYNRVSGVVKLTSGRIKRLGWSYNARTNVGAGITAYLMSGSNLASLSSPAVPKYIALSAGTISPLMGDTTLSGETSKSGLARAVGTIGGYSAPTYLDGPASYTITYTFTNNSGSPFTVQSVGLFDASSTGNLFAESNLALAAYLPNPGDQVIVTWNVNI
jgi:hypothetical protein